MSTPTSRELVPAVIPPITLAPVVRDACLGPMTFAAFDRPRVVLSTVIQEPSFRHRRAPRTLRSYERSLSRLAAHGVVTTDDAAPAKVQAFIDARLERVQPQSVRVDIVGLYAVLSHLERTGRYAVEDLRRLYRLKPYVEPRQELSAAFLSREQVEHLARVARAQGPGSQLVELTIWLAALSGLRAGELCRLRWADVDLAQRLLVVRSSRVARTKTGRSRKVPICAELLSILAGHPGAVVTRAAGGLVLSLKTVRPRTLARRIERVRVRAGLPDASLVTLRHTRASWWIQAGVPPVKVAKWLGHSVEVCLSHYGGLSEAYDAACELGGEPPAAPSPRSFEPPAAPSPRSFEAPPIGHDPTASGRVERKGNRAWLVDASGVVADLGRGASEAALLDTLLALPGVALGPRELAAAIVARTGLTIDATSTYSRLAKRLAGTSYRLVPTGTGRVYGLAARASWGPA